MRYAAAVCLLLCAACRPSSSPDTEAPLLRYDSDSAWSQSVPLPGIGNGRYLVTNSKSDTVSLLDAERVGEPSLPELAQLPVGLNPVETEGPHHAAISPDGQTYFIGLSQNAPGSGSGPHGAHGTGSVDGSVLKYRALDHQLLGSVRVDRNPGDLILSPDGAVVAVSHFDLARVAEAARGEVSSPDARVILIDAQTLDVLARITVCAAPHGLAFSADGARLYVACYSDEVAVVSMTDAQRPVTHVKVASNAGTAFTATYQPYAVAVSPLNGDVFISCLASSEVRVLESATLTMKASTVRVNGSPLLSAFTPAGDGLWVPVQGSDTVVDVDPVTVTVRRTLPLPAASCLAVHQVTFTRDGRFALAVCEGNHLAPGSVLVLEPQSAQVHSVTKVGVYPDFIGLLKP